MTNKAEHAEDIAGVDRRVADRYEIHEELGRGGMACVYRATDLSTGQQVALKQLLVPGHAPERATVAALFEREFHTLAQLRHPRVIAVYDYGLSADGNPYYTMELLDGGDLRDRAPLPWREVCALLFDVCSSLALLHSRRLLHRDISPRNIRCTRDGKAKLIDFGAMAPMNAGGAQVVGTPAFTPPETVHRLALDARADLYSLGATLYHSLTGHLPYPARTFADVLSAWEFKAAAPSMHVPSIPAALDELVLSLISLEPALRPRSAFDVMQRLAAIAELAGDESDEVSSAYLATPTLVGRSEPLARLREKLTAPRATRTTGMMLDGAAGIGRSRLLDALALDAKTLGFTVLRATASGTREPFAIARGLTQHLLDALPSAGFEAQFAQLFADPSSAPAPGPANDNTLQAAVPARSSLRNFADPTLDSEQLQRTICRFVLTVSRRYPLLIAVDDVHRIDQASASVLAALIDKAKRGRIFVALTADSGEPSDAALEVLSRRCDTLRLEALSRDQTHLLLGSLFGDVANLDMLASEIHGVALGNPGQSMAMAQHLVDEQLIRYAAGTWTLPNRLSAADLPRSAADATHARIERLSPLARSLGEAHALAFYETFSDLDYRALSPAATPQHVDNALQELLTVGALVTDGAVYMLANRVWTAAFVAGLEDGALKRTHSALAEAYRHKSAIALIHHLFSAGLNEQGLNAMLARQVEYNKGVDHRILLEQNVTKMIWCHPRAIETALRLGRSAREVSELRRWFFAGSVASEGNLAVEEAQLWLEQLEHDSGLALYRLYTDAPTPGERLTRALQDAYHRYMATPENARVYAVDEAIRLLAEYVVYAIAIGARANDWRLLATLPPILEPFAMLSPVLDAIWNNAVATESGLCQCQHELARARWIEVLNNLDALKGTEMQHIEAISSAVAFAIGLMEARLGLASAASWTARLDNDPQQRISALHLRRIVRLEQGDWNGADRLRRQAEVLSLQQRAPQMFHSLLSVELASCVKARDLGGTQQLIEHMKRLAAMYPGWQVELVCAQACFQLVRGDLHGAKAGFEACIAQTAFDEAGVSRGTAAWVASQAGLAETLLALDRTEEARDRASAALRICDAHQIGSHAFDLTRMLALAEAKLGDSAAAARLDALIAKQQELGVSGLRLGLSYEARAQIALWTHDANGFQHYARLTAREYRHGTSSPLGARYERLVNEAARYGVQASSALSEFATSSALASSAMATDDIQTMVLRSMLGVDRIEQRAQAALHLICDARGARIGHLYLMSEQGLALAASFGASRAPNNLIDVVTEYVSKEQQSSETMTVMATGNLLDEAQDTSTTNIAGETYQLLLLSCVVDAVGQVAGVAAVVADKTPAINAMQGQLLPLLAKHLLQNEA